METSELEEPEEGTSTRLAKQFNEFFPFQKKNLRGGAETQRATSREDEVRSATGCAVISRALRSTCVRWDGVAWRRSCACLLYSSLLLVSRASRLLQWYEALPMRRRKLLMPACKIQEQKSDVENKSKRTV